MIIKYKNNTYKKKDICDSTNKMSYVLQHVTKAHILFRCLDFFFDAQHGMFQYRNYSFPNKFPDQKSVEQVLKKHKFVTLHGVRDDKKPVTLLLFPDSIKKNTKLEIETLLETVQSNHVILVCNNITKQSLLSLQQTNVVEHFTYVECLSKFPQHFSVRNLQSKKITNQPLPIQNMELSKIKQDDMLCKFFRYIPGDIIEFQRSTPLIGFSKEYRIVVP